MNLLAFVMAGCVISVDERRIMQPPDRPTAAQLDADVVRGAEALRRFPIVMKRDGLELPATFLELEHGKIAGDDLSIAWSFASFDHAFRPVIIDCTGAEADRHSYGAYTIRFLMGLGDVFLYDYPGYGESGGEATVPDFSTAAAEVGQYVRDRFSDRQRVYWGYSLGAFSCTRMALDDPDAAFLVLEAPTPSIHAAVDGYVPRWLRPWLRLDISDEVAAIDLTADLRALERPAYVLLAGNDDVLAPKNAMPMVEALWAEGKELGLIVFDDANHYTIKRQPEFLPSLIDVFFKEGVLPPDLTFHYEIRDAKATSDDGAP